MGTIVDPFYAHRHIDFQKELSHETLAQRVAACGQWHRGRHDEVAKAELCREQRPLRARRLDAGEVLGFPTYCR